MARTKRKTSSFPSAPAPLVREAPHDLVDGVPAPVLEKRLAEIRRCKQVQGDGNTAHASAWKALGEAGANADGWKIALRLERMECQKRAAILRSFDAARRFLNLDAQMEMPLEVREEASEGNGALVSLGEVLAEAEAAVAAESAVGEVIGDADEVAPWAPAEVKPDDPALDKGGDHFAAGRLAGIDGATSSDNPHKRSSGAWGLWEAGRQKGLTQAAEPAMQADDIAAYRPSFPDALGAN